LLDRLDLLAHRLLGHEELRRGRGEASQLGHLHERAHLAKFRACHAAMV
jgi:hypothetical protein